MIRWGSAKKNIGRRPRKQPEDVGEPHPQHLFSKCPKGGTLKIRNWHKRNTRAAKEIETTATVCNGGALDCFVQIRLVSSLGNLNLTLTPTEAMELSAQINHCFSRYQ